MIATANSYSAASEPISEAAGACRTFADYPVGLLAVTYVVLLPLLVLAVHGGFSFEHGSWNSNLGAVGGKIAIADSSADKLRDSLQSWITLTICLGLSFPFHRQIARLCGQLPVMLILPLYAISSACWSQDPGLTLRSGLSLLVMTFFAFYLASRFSQRQLLQLVIFTGWFVGIATVALGLLWPEFGVDHQLHEGAWQGLYTQKNVCAEATLFLLTPALALSGPGRCTQFFRFIYIALCLGLIAMTQSRTGWAMTVIYLAFFCGLRTLGKFDRRGLLPFAALAVAAAAACVMVAVSYPSAMLAVVERSDSFSGRAQIWTAIAASIMRSPAIGYGYDAFWALLQGEASRVFAAAGWVVTSAHNGFLNVGLELGLVGVALFLLTFAQAFRHASRAFYPGHSRYVDWCIGIVFLTVVYNLDERTLLATQYLPWVLYIIACAGLRDAALRNTTGEASFTGTARGRL